MIMATIAAHILRNPTGILISLICFSPLVHSEDYNRRQDRLLFRSQSTFQCESEGFHPDTYDCSIFYRCIDWGEGSENSLQSRFTTFRFQCKEGAIYDINTGGCVHPSESSRTECKNQRQHEPLLINIPRAEALQSAANNRDYGVVEPQENNPPTSQPPYGNKPSSQGSQIDPETDPNNNIADEQPPRVTRSPPCSAEGFFAIENDCSHFYRCVGNGKGFLKYEFSCGEGTVWDPDNNACNHAWAVQRNDCKSNTGLNGNQDENNSVDGNDNQNPEQISQGFSSSETPNSNNGYPAGQQPSSPSNPSYGQGGFNNEYQPSNQPTNGYQPNRPPNNGYPPYNGYPPSNGNSPGQQFSSTPYPAYGQGNSNGGYPPNGFSNNGYPSQNGYPNNQQLSSTTKSPYGPGNLNNVNQPNNNSPNNQNPPSNNYPSNQQPPSSGNQPNGPEDPSNGPSNGSSNNGNAPVNSNSGTSCPSEGFHGVENNCKKFIRCVSNGNGGFTKYEFDCAEGTVWDNDSVTCNYPYAVQDPKCRSSITSEPTDSNQDSNQQTPSPSSGENVSSAFTPQNSPISGSQSQGQTTPYGSQQTSSSNEQTSSSNQQTSSSSSQTSSTSSSFNQQTSSSSSSSSSTSSGQQTTSTNNNNQQGSTAGSNQQTTNNQQTSASGSNQQTSSSNQQSTSGSNQQSTSSQQQSTTSGNQQTSGGNSNTVGSGQQTTSSGQQGSTSTTNQQSSGNQQGSTTGSSQQTTSSGQQTSSTGSSQQTTSSSNQQTSSENNSGTTSSTDQQNINSSTTNGNNNINSGSQTTNNPNKEDKCTSEGFFPSSSNCNKFYRCVSNGGSGYTKYEFNCGPGTVWDPDQNTCNHPWAVQNEKCRSNSSQIPASGSDSSNKTEPNSSSSTESLSTTVTSSSTPSTLPSSSLSSSPVPVSSPGSSTTKPVYGGQSTPPGSSTTRPVYGGPSTTPGSSTTRPVYGGQSTPISSASNQNPSTPVTSSPNYTSKPTENQTNLSNTTGKPTSTVKPSGSGNPTTLAGSTSSDNATSTTPVNEISTNSPTTTPGSTTGNGTKPITKVNCTKAGFYPHPTDCKKFYRCVDWDGDKGQRFSVYHFDCPAGTIFDPSLDTCNHEESVYPPRQCDGSAQVTEPPTTNCTETAITPDSSTNGTQPTELPSTSNNVTETTTSPGENMSTTPSESGTTDTAEQITTTSPTNGSITTQSSTPGITDATTEGSTGETTQGATSSSEAPTYPTNAGATNPPSSITMTSKPEESSTLNPTTVEPTTTSTSASEKCPELGPDQFALVCPTGFRRHPKYCNVFYQCTVSQTNEIKVLTLSCTNGTVYDDRKIQCLPPSQAQKCEGSMMDTRNLRKLSDSPGSPIAVKSDKSICPGEGSFAFKDDCRLFYKCQKSEGRLNGYVYQCPEGYGYWNVSKRCEKIEKVPCEGGQKTKPISKPTLAPEETKNIGH